MSHNHLSNKSSKRNLRIKTALLLTGLLAVISGCSGTDSADPGANAAAGADSGQLHRVTVMLDWYPNAVHSFCMQLRRKVILLRKAWRLTCKCLLTAMMP